LNSPYISQFRISDLEGFSGVKAHTIRIWEKRYNLLEPDRTGSNYRTYSLSELTTILNVVFLVNHGYRIGKVADMKPEERSAKVREISSAKAELGETLNALKVAMLSFDESLFRSASAACQQKEGFKALVEGVYVPLLEHIGHLWHSGSICPSQEHFVSNLIRQRILAETDSMPLAQTGDQLYVLYLPDQEIHELGLLYTNYVLRSLGHRTIYLGQSVPTDDLHQIAGMFAGPITYIGFITSFPAADRLQHFMDGLRAQIPDPMHRFWFTGSQVNRAEGLSPAAGVSVFPHIKDMIDAFPAKP
jgi:MerR family transcriptional regulator, light-induced transcriptional regulator